MTVPNESAYGPELSRRRFLHAVGTLGAGLTLAAGRAVAGAAPGKATKAASRPSPAVPLAARPLPLTAVRLTGGPLKHAQDLNAGYLLALEPDRMMAFFRKDAGLEPKAQGYGGWDGGGRNLTGHIAGHYLSAVSLMYAATGDRRFKQRAEHLVEEMRVVQSRYPDGYLGALEGGREKFAEVARGDIRSGGFDLNGLWSPWYVQHKIFAGLRDAYRHTGNRTALAVEVKFAAWAEGVIAPLTEEQDQKMLQTEFGGMGEVMADLAADTGERRWMALSDRFQHHAVLDPLARREDHLGGLHANTQVPKLVASLARYLDTGRAEDGAAATFFWDAVVRHHSFATGGHGKDEYFGPPDELADRMDGRTDESCNVYNMLKLTRELFALTPDIKYAEFQERALFNHVLGSMDPEDGRTCYMVPVGQGVTREYQDMFHDFTCCVGSGMENHALHGHGIYYESGDRLWVNLYAPSRAQWRSARAHLAMEASFPEGETAALTLTLNAPVKRTLLLRRPAWAGEGFAVTVNGRAVTDLPGPGAYVALTRLWKSGDVVRLALPKALHREPLPDNPRRAALLWGPLVLAEDQGPEPKEAGVHPTPTVFVAAERPLADWLEPVPGRPGTFRSAAGVGRDSGGSGQTRTVDFVPFYRLHRRTYAAHFDLYTDAEWRQKADEIAADLEAQRRRDAATVAYAQPGQMQTERDFNEQGEETSPDRVLGRPGRRARKWFSFDLPVDPAHPMALRVTYSTQEFRTRTFDILVDGRPVGQQEIVRSVPGSPTRFFDATYPLPDALVQGKSKVTVRFEATGGNETGMVFGIRMLRADAPL